MKHGSYLLLAVAAWMGCQGNKPAEVYSPYSMVEAISEKYQVLPIKEIRPEGWIREQIQDNLNGFVGHLDSLVSKLIVEDQIYGRDRLTKRIKSKEVGALSDSGNWQVQFLWWNSETQSNWRDGYIRSAILANDLHHLEKIKTYVQYILSTQDADGYLGIYDRDLRYSFDNENGELWAKSSLLRGLLAWYEYTGDEKTLIAIERAAQNVMAHYPANASHPFYSRQPNVGGTSHGLTITDIFESLFRITGKAVYRDYCLFLYKDFSEQNLNEDAQYPKLMNDTLMLRGHGVHTYEHVRSLAAAYYASGSPKLKIALDKFLSKIKGETTASGAGVGDEWIGGRRADATNRGYEYCSLHELMHSYISLLVKSGDKLFGDKTEKIFFNAAQGARHPSKSCIAYLKTDNSYYMTGGLNGDNRNKNQTRYTYSPVHQEAAVCCVPNAGRIAPYYVQHMWLKDKNALVASLLGPCEVSTALHDKMISVKELTNYPFENTVRFEVAADQNFALKIRKPDWIRNFSVSEAYQEKDGFIVIDKVWSGRQTVDVKFDASVMVHDDLNAEKYFTYGALVLARPIDEIEEKGKSFPVEGYFNYKYSPRHLVVYNYSKKKIVKGIKPLQFKTRLLNSVTNKNDSVDLVPMANTILRQITFK